MSKSHRLAAIAALAFASAATQAATFSFSGITDSGPLLGESFSGQFSYDDSSVLADGDVSLSGFSLSFFGQSYGLFSADAGTTPAATFAGGSFVGLSFIGSETAALPARPSVGFVAGFGSFGEAYFGYGAAAGEGFGSYTVSAVPEPHSIALMLAGLGVVGWRARHLQRAA